MNYLFIILGVVSLGIGLLGVVLPILPTTPFLLLTAFFFTKGSHRFHDWFTTTWIYERHLKSFIETRQMTRKKKWQLMIFVDLMLIISALIMQSIIFTIIIVLLDIFKYIYFFTKVKTIDS